MEITETDFAASPARVLLAEALAARPPRLDLAAIAISRVESPTLQPAAVEARLDELAARVRERLPGQPDIPAKVAALSTLLGEDEGLGGNRDHYDEPENSFIEHVLERRVGLPITLSVIWVEVARRVGIPLYGVGYPGHFLVACHATGEPIVLDPFAHGRILDRAACEELLARFAPGIEFSPALLAPTATRTIVVRMLTNLKHAYLRRQDSGRVLRVVDLLLSLLPDHPGELRARAAALTALGAHRAALADLQRCLELTPTAGDRDVLEASAKALSSKLGPVN